MTNPITYGTWEVSKDATPDYAPQFTIYAEDTGERVATVFQTPANARLIAAAPDMLRALKLADEYIYETIYEATPRTSVKDSGRILRAVVDAISLATEG